MRSVRECKERTYATSKNKRKHPDRLELNKFCPLKAATLSAQASLPK